MSKITANSPLYSASFAWSIKGILHEVVFKPRNKPPVIMHRRRLVFFSVRVDTVIKSHFYETSLKINATTARHFLNVALQADAEVEPIL